MVSTRLRSPRVTVDSDTLEISALGRTSGVWMVGQPRGRASMYFSRLRRCRRVLLTTCYDQRPRVFTFYFLLQVSSAWRWVVYHCCPKPRYALLGAWQLLSFIASNHNDDHQFLSFFERQLSASSQHLMTVSESLRILRLVLTCKCSPSPCNPASCSLHCITA